MTYERTEEEELRILVVGFAFVSPLAFTTKAVIIFLHQHKRICICILSEFSFIFAFVVRLIFCSKAIPGFFPFDKKCTLTIHAIASGHCHALTLFYKTFTQHRVTEISKLKSNIFSTLIELLN